ncbi:hypothetical protein BT96DRAFT_1048957 [Gymnopus androsaceus JB14]|uniref:Uncharacterized protein n=1 Tax=Gymnopus androsaceus JB14 TaxID=1447944 RepID=A0A6A4GB06_9AGAR|nr:hypothetical protein BT96DRAFT_1048957 [Gymnopus androsaceus JB14]
MSYQYTSSDELKVTLDSIPMGNKLVGNAESKKSPIEDAQVKCLLTDLVTTVATTYTNLHWGNCVWITREDGVGGLSFYRQPQSDLFLSNPALNRHVVELIRYIPF